MSAHATQPEPNTNPGPQAEDDQFYREILHGLIEVGAELVRHLPQQAAQAQAPQQHPAPQPAPALSSDAVASVATAYDRISRAVRRCIALARSFNDPAHTPKHPPHHRADARKRILRAVEDTLGRQDYDDSYRVCDPTEALHAELLDRMDAPDLDRDIANRPIDDIIKDILRDLGLAALPGTRPWKRRTPSDIEQLNARAAAPSRPAGSTPRPGPQDGHPAAARQAPDPQPDQREPGHPADTRPQPGPTNAGSVRRGPTDPRPGLPKDPAEAVAFVLRHAADARWRPPPSG